jgi:hypothetical protein
MLGAMGEKNQTGSYDQFQIGNLSSPSWSGEPLLLQFTHATEYYIRCLVEGDRSIDQVLCSIVLAEG